MKLINPVLISFLLALGLVASTAFAGAEANAPHGLDKQLLASSAWLTLPGYPDHRGNLQFMPLPAGTLDAMRNVYVGQTAITVRPNEGLFLPMFYWFGETYADGSQDDPDFPAPADFLGCNVMLTLDGDVILDSSDGLADNYVDTTYYPQPLVYPVPTGYGSVNTYFVKGLCASIGTMSPGTHELHLVITSPWILSVAGFNGWDNTWAISVEK